jgi:hypothetical protein
VNRSIVELWSRPAGGPVPNHTDTPTVALRRFEPHDELVIARAVQRKLGPHAAAALSMVPGEIDLADTRERFARAGLERSRSCDIVTRAGVATYAVLEERSTPGLNLTWMLNASWIIPIHAELDGDAAALDAALRSVVSRPAQTATGEHFVNLPEGLDTDRLGAWGFEKEASVYLYVLTRAGLHRFFTYASHRYGEVDAMTARRERRRASQSD